MARNGLGDRAGLLRRSAGRPPGVRKAGSAAPGAGSSALLIWSAAAVAVVWLGVFVSGTGLDVLVLVMVACGIVVFDRLVGDYAADLLGPGLASITLAAALGGMGWLLFAKDGKADQFFESAEESGYTTLFYRPAPARDPLPQPADANPDTPPGGAPPTRRATAGRPTMGPAITAPSDDETRARTTGPLLKETSAGLLEGLGLRRGEMIKPVVRLETPEMTVTGRRVALHAHVIARGKPVAGAAVTFTANGRNVATSKTDARGIATATFAPGAAHIYEIRARVTRSGDLLDAAGSTLLHVIPGRS